MGSHQRHEGVDLTDEPTGHNSALPPGYSPWSTPSSYYDVARNSACYAGGVLMESSGREAKRFKYSTTDAVPSTPGQPPPVQGHDLSSKSTHKAPSVRDINEALKNSDSRVPLLDQVPANTPRALQFGRVPQPTISAAWNDSRSPSYTTSINQDSNRPTPHYTAHTSTTQANYRVSQTQANVQWPVAMSQSLSRSGQATFEDGNNRVPAASYKEDVQAPKAAHTVGCDIAAAGFRLIRPLPTPTLPYNAPILPQTAPILPQIAPKLPHITPKLLQTTPTLSQPTPKLPRAAPASAPKRPRYLNQFSDEENQFLIFLKEVKPYCWKQITSEFNMEFPTRPYSSLQLHYSNVLNKRNRSEDPAILSLPPRFASEAVIDWQTIRANGARAKGQSRNRSQQKSAASGNHKVLQSKPREGSVPQSFPIRHAPDNDYSSGGDSAPRREKSSRARRVDYTWPKSRGKGEDVETVDAVVHDYTMFAEEIEEVATPVEEDEITPEANVAVVREPLEVVFEAADARLASKLRNGLVGSSSPKLPYMSVAQIAAVKERDLEYAQFPQHIKTLQGRTLHVDFTLDELKSVEESISRVLGPSPRSRHETRRRQLRERLRGSTEAKLLQLLHELRRHLRLRDEQSIKAFLQDAKAGKIADFPHVQRLAGLCPDDRWSTRRFASSSAMLREREMGRQSRRGWRAASRPLTYQLKNKVMDTFGSSASWTGASGDIHAVAWAPDGENFAAAAVAVDDPMSMQYNRPNNLLFGECSQNAIYELGEHYREREITEHGPNSTHAMFASQDPKIHNTVSSLGFSRNGDLLYSAGYDGHICVWYTNSEDSRPKLGAKLNVKAPIDMITINPVFDGILAAAVKVSNDKAIRLLRINEQDPDQFEKHNLHSAKAILRPDLKILPTAIQFDPRFGDKLLAGFGANARDSGFDTTGDVCLWDVGTVTPLNVYASSVNVFDVEFNPNRSVMPLFAVGGVAGNNVNRGTRSTVRLYDERADNRFGLATEIECKALDINDVVWCPHDEYLIAAGCTDGRAYVWDVRHEMDPLHVLTHGRSVMPLQDGIKHEETDTGVRFLSWGENATRLYSGSSDGVVKVWDVTRSKEDMFINDMLHANSGIMSGAFSPDFSKLVVGEVNGSVNVLEVGRDSCPPATTARLRHVPYDDSDDQEVDGLGVASTSNLGTMEARRLLDTSQVAVIPMGTLPIRQVVRGPRYTGPFDRSEEAPLLREQASAFQDRMAIVPGPQCDLPACKANVNKTTIEDIGDSERSLDRIPDQLCRAWKSVDSTPHIVPGKSKCTQCGRSARLSMGDSWATTSLLCERCAFACFRCGTALAILPGATSLSCSSCAGTWDMGTLGFECIKDPRPTSTALNVPPLKAFERSAFLDRLEDADSSFGCEMNALSDHYFSLAIDRPESPPL